MNFLTPILIILLPPLLFLLGYKVGQWRSTKEIKKLINTRRNSYLLGQMTTDEMQRKELAKAYYNSDSAYKEMANYHWDAEALILSPFIGYAPAPSNSKNLQINSSQFCAFENVILPKPNGVFRIFIVGASTAFGSGAPDQERTITGYLKKLLHSNNKERQLKYEVFTVAAPAWGSSHERIAIENLVSEMEPDLVITFSGNNEAHWGWNFKNTFWFRSYADNHFWKIINAAYCSAGFSTFEDPIKDRDKILPPDSLSMNLKKNMDLSCYALRPTGSKHFYIFQPAITLTKKPMSRREKKILSVWHPKQIEYFRKYHRLANVELKMLEKSHKIFQFFDLVDIFDDMNEKDEIFLDSCHFGDKGYDIISKKIYSLILPEISRGKINN